jgi:hypothetical protein
MTDRDALLRQHLVTLLTEGNAHAPISKILSGVPPAIQGERPPGFSHSPWEILEHLRIAQQDILEYVRDPHWVSPEWPQGYWPESPAPPDEGAWQRSEEAFLEDLKQLRSLVEHPGVDLLAPIPHAKAGHTVLREVLLTADHNGYHGAELVAVRRALGAWSS